MYFSAIMFMCSLSVVCTVLVLNCHHRSPDTHVMPYWVRLLLFLIGVNSVRGPKCVTRGYRPTHTEIVNT